MALLMDLTTILTGASLLILMTLLYVYIRNFKNIKSKFTVGLIIFAALFFIQNLVSLYFYITMMDYYVPQVSIHIFILTLLQTIAFLTLLIITWE